MLIKQEKAVLVEGAMEGTLVVDEIVITDGIKNTNAAFPLRSFSIQTSAWFPGAMPGDESGVDLFEDDEELEQAAQQMFDEENDEEEELVRMMEEVEATPIESLPGWVSC